jgi:hypothetical protein
VQVFASDHPHRIRSVAFRARREVGPAPRLPGGHQKRRERLRARLLVAWRGAELDRQLARGVEPHSSLLLELRAGKLTSARGRRRLADGLERTYRRAQTASSPRFTATVPPNVPELLDAQPVLITIERRLRSSAPVGARGVAMIHTLLTNGASPLYQVGHPGELASDLRAAAAALEPRRPVEAWCKPPLAGGDPQPRAEPLTVTAGAAR